MIRHSKRSNRHRTGTDKTRKRREPALGQNDVKWRAARRLRGKPALWAGNGTQGAQKTPFLTPPIRWAPVGTELRGSRCGTWSGCHWLSERQNASPSSENMIASGASAGRLQPPTDGRVTAHWLRSRVSGNANQSHSGSLVLDSRSLSATRSHRAFPHRCDGTFFAASTRKLTHPARLQPALTEPPLHGVDCREFPVGFAECPAGHLPPEAKPSLVIPRSFDHAHPSPQTDPRRPE